MAYSTEILADSPAGYWRLGESTGTTAADDSGNGFAGTYSGTVSLGETALINDADTAVDFSGGGVVQIGDTANDIFGSTSAITLEAWVNVSDVTTDQVIIDMGGNGAGVFLQIGGGEAHLVRALSSTSFTISASISINTTYHIVGTIDASGNMVLYIDGSSAATGSVTADSNWGASFCSVGNAYHFGRLYDDSHYTSSGEIIYPVLGVVDEAAVYGTALSSTRIAAHYSEGVGAGGTTHEGSVSETVDLSDALSTTADFSASLQEQVDLTATLSTTADFSASLAESIDLQAAFSTTADFEASLSEPVLMSDSAGGGLDIAASLSEAITLAAAQDADITIEASVSESLLLSESLSVTADFAALLTEAITLADAAQTTADYEAALTEAVELAEAIVGGALLEAGITESVTLSSTFTATAIVTGVTLSDGRTFTVSLESRTFTPQDNRIFTVPQETREYTA